jgi:hypothetical protein
MRSKRFCRGDEADWRRAHGRSRKAFSESAADSRRKIDIYASNTYGEVDPPAPK